MRTRLFLVFLVLMMLFGGGVVQAGDVADREVAGKIEYKVTGNAKRFGPARWKKTGKIRLADSTVRRVSIHDSGRSVDPRFMNQSTMQQIFDEILAGKVIVKTTSEQIKLGWNNALSGIETTGVMLSCYTGYNKKRGRHRYTDLTLVCLDAEKFQVDDIVLVAAQSFTGNGAVSGGVYVQSKTLYDLVETIYQQEYTARDLKEAVAVDWDRSSSVKPENARTQDRSTIRKLVDAFVSGEPVDVAEELLPTMEFAFTMSDGRSFGVRLVGDYPLDGNEKRFYSYTPNGIYRIDPEQVIAIIREAGLEDIRTMFE